MQREYEKAKNVSSTNEAVTNVDTLKLQRVIEATQSVQPISFSHLPLDFNWNSEPHALSRVPDTLASEPTPQQAATTEFISECLRDGLHGTAIYPSVEKMLRYAHALNDFGIKRAIIGIYSGEQNVVDKTIRELLRCLRDTLPSLTPLVLCLCTPEALKWTARCKDIHPGLEAYIFMGSAPSRRLVQEWDLAFILRQLSHSVSEAVRLGIPVTAATEHATQTPPDDLKQIIQVQVEQGARGFVLTDTIGIARPCGAYRIVRFTKAILDKLNVGDSKVEWHGHRDTGNSLANALMAIAAGAVRIHVVSRGIGERSGNTALEDLVLNLAAILTEANQPVPWNMSQLLSLLSLYENITEVPTPLYGSLGKRYNHTTLGIHTDALLKTRLLSEQASQAKNAEVANTLQRMARTIYSAVDPYAIGGQWSVGVSPWSGRSSVRLAYLAYGGKPEDLSPKTIDLILEHAQEVGRELEPLELQLLFQQSRP